MIIEAEARLRVILELVVSFKVFRLWIVRMVTSLNSWGPRSKKLGHTSSYGISWRVNGKNAAS